jgi:hypothetical protein
MSELPRAVEVTPYAFAVMTNTLGRGISMSPSGRGKPGLRPVLKVARLHDEEEEGIRGRAMRLHQARLVICDMGTAGLRTEVSRLDKCPTCPNSSCPAAPVPCAVASTGMRFCGGRPWKRSTRWVNRCVVQRVDMMSTWRGRVSST